MLRNLIFSALLAVFQAGPLLADKPVYHAQSGAAIGGYDAVAYFTDGVAVRGAPGIVVMWKGVVWHFASDAHREAFEANPRAYAPQYGGYCAYAVSQGYTATTDPTAWRIMDGKLYLTHSKSILSRWMRDPTGYLAKSEANWPAVLFD